MRRLARNQDFGALQQTFLLTAVVTVLVIRTELWLTNYPQLGGSGLHIAHLLWGGLFMVLAIGVLVTLLGPRVRHGAALLGGVGFGFFIDELGKFITEDNNYFFKPAPGVIYAVFVILFLVSRWLQRRGPLSAPERVRNAAELVAKAAQRTYTAADRRRVLALLDGVDERQPLAEPLRRLAGELEVTPERPPGRLARLVAGGRERVDRLTAAALFARVMGVIFLLWGVISAVGVVALVAGLGLALGGAREGFVSDALSELRFANVAPLISGVVSSILVLVGVVRLRRHNRLGAYRAFEQALLVSILITRVFVFVESQFSAVVGAAVDILLLLAVRRLADSERRHPSAEAEESRDPLLIRAVSGAG